MEYRLGKLLKIKMYDIVIIGCGPRGLGIALQAVTKKMSVCLIDDEPLNTWKNNWLNYQMRSPVSFDLVGNIEQLQDYSLAKYSRLESYEFCDRRTFYNYLKDIYLDLIKNSLVSIFKSNVQKIEDHCVITTSKQKIFGKQIVLAISPTSAIVPAYLNNYRYKIVNKSFLVSSRQQKYFIGIIGSGQNAAELVAYFSKIYQVYWFTKHEIRVYQYPMPDRQLWGVRSGFSNWFRNLKTIEAKQKYLKEIKNWQPSMTPYIDLKLKNVEYNKVDTVSLNKVQTVLNKIDYIILANGKKTNIANCTLFSTLPKTEVSVPEYPEVKPGYKLSIDFISVTGNLALYYDGPRQGSVYSIPQTSKEILDYA